MHGALSGIWHGFVRTAAVAALLALSITGLTVQHYRLDAHRTTMAKNVALVARIRRMPSVDALKRFDGTIKSMSHPARADDELLALMQ